MGLRKVALWGQAQDRSLLAVTQRIWLSYFVVQWRRVEHGHGAQGEPCFYGALLGGMGTAAVGA